MRDSSSAGREFKPHGGDKFCSSKTVENDCGLQTAEHCFHIKSRSSGLVLSRTVWPQIFFIIMWTSRVFQLSYSRTFVLSYFRTGSAPVTAVLDFFP